MASPKSSSNSLNEAARPLLERAVQRHGGQANFDRLSAIDLRIDSLRGIVPWWKGQGTTFDLPNRVTFVPELDEVRFTDDASQRIHYGHGCVQDESGVHPCYRTRFLALQKLRRWNRLDAAYFFGYALAEYLSLPFSLLDLSRTQDIVRVRQFANKSYSITRLTPAGSDTHSERQTFWFDASGLLVRHDYHADILGYGFWGAHLSSGYREDLPIVVAQDRAVYARLGSWKSPVRVLHARLDVLQLHGL